MVAGGLIPYSKSAEESDRIEIKVETNDEHNLFAPGERVEIIVSVPENEASRLSGKKGTLRCELVDFFGNRVGENAFSFIFGEKKPLLKVTCTLDEGFYWANVALEVNGEKIGCRRVGIGVIPSDLAELETRFDSFFGVCSLRSPELMRRAGIRWARVGICWKSVEKEPGIFNWKSTDRLVKDANKEDVLLLGILGYPVPEWAADVPPDFKPIGVGVHAGWDAFPPKPECLDEWGRYVYETVKRYKENVAAWEIWNEPFPDGLFFRGGTVQDYVDLLKVAYTEAKRADPDCIIVGLGGTDFIHMRQVFEQGGFPYMDVASIHHYQPGMYPEFYFPWMVRRAKEVMREYAKKNQAKQKDIWLTETGWPTNLTDFSIPQNWSGTPMELRAKFLPRTFILGAAAGLDKIFWFTFKDGGRDPKNFEHNQGLFFYDLTPKPSYVAYATLIRMLDNLEYRGKLHLSSRVYGYWFEGENGGCVTIWTTFPEAELIVPRMPADLKIFGLMGKELEPQVVNGEWHLPVSDAVVYLVCENVQDLKSAIEEARIVYPIDMLPVYLLVAFAGLLGFGAFRAKKGKEGLEVDSFRIVFQPFSFSKKPRHGVPRTLVFALLMISFVSIFIYKLAGWILYEFPVAFPTSIPGWDVLPLMIMGVLRNPLLIACVGLLGLVFYSALYYLFCKIFKGGLGLFACLEVIGWSTASFVLFLPATFIGSLVIEAHLLRLLISSLMVTWVWSAVLTIIETRGLGVSTARAVGMRVSCDLLLFTVGVLVLMVTAAEFHGPSATELMRMVLQI